MKMNMFTPTRRGFVKGGLATAALRFRAPLLWRDSRRLTTSWCVVFLRGGMDGLDLIPPVSGPDRAIYEAARPTLDVPLCGSGAALTLDGGFGLHPAAASLMPLYDQRTDGRRPRDRDAQPDPQPLRGPGLYRARHTGRKDDRQRAGSTATWPARPTCRPRS